MSQELLIDLTECGTSDYKSVYEVDDQPKIDFANYIEERIMNKVNKIITEKDKEIKELADVINLQSIEIGKLKEKLSAHEFMTDGIFESLTERIDNNYIVIKAVDRNIKRVYDLYQDFEYGELRIGGGGKFNIYYTNVYTDHIVINYDTTYNNFGGYPFDVNVKVFNLSKLKYTKVNIPQNKFNYSKMFIRFIVRNNEDINIFKKHNVTSVNIRPDGDGFSFGPYNIIILMLLLNINIIVDVENKSINIREINDKNIVNIDIILNWEPYKNLKNALIECGYILQSDTI